MTNYVANNLTNSPSPAETLERLCLTSNMSSEQWYDVLQLSWSEYNDLKLGRLTSSKSVYERVAGEFKLRPTQIISGNIDFKSIALEFEKKDLIIPENYTNAAYGRKRTSITSIDFLESYSGWRLRTDAIRNLSVSEGFLQDPFAPISMNFITDLCAYLQKRQFQAEDFFAMGAYSFIGNKNSIISRLLSDFTCVKDAYAFLLNDCMKLFELNCTYKIIKANDTSLTVDYITNADVAAETGVRHLGNVPVCHTKRGFAAVVPLYLGLPKALVKKTACVHKGDDVCRLEIDFIEAAKTKFTRPLLNN